MMDTATLERGVLKAKVTATPTDGQGIFDFEVYCFEVDSDNERIKNFSNVGTGKPAANVPLDYQHTPEEVDPLGTIGTARVKQVGDHLAGTAKLDIDSNPMAVAIYERLLLPEDDPARLSEVSIFFAYETAKAFEGPKGELVQVDCELLGVAVVHKGAQRTRVTNVKEDKAWDGAAAMASCSSAADYRKIAFERNNDSDPDTAAHWALPHHQSPGAEADPQGVAAALGALAGARGGAPDLKDAGAARSHLEAHRGEEMSAESGKASLGTATIDIMPRFVGPFADMLYAQTEGTYITNGPDVTWSPATLTAPKAGRVLSSKNEAKLRQAGELLTEVLASVRSTSDEDEPKAEEAKSDDARGAEGEEPTKPTEYELLRARIAGLG